MRNYADVQLSGRKQAWSMLVCAWKILRYGRVTLRISGKLFINDQLISE